MNKTEYAKTDELVIDKSNFYQYFKDVRLHRPQRGEVMAKFRSTAEFVDGPTKRDVIEILQTMNGPEAAVQIMRKLGCATQDDAFKVPLEIAKDLIDGMSVEEVASKPYQYIIEVFYWTKKEYIPDDPHWTAVGIVNLDEFCDKRGKVSIKSEVKGEIPEHYEVHDVEASGSSVLVEREVARTAD